MNLQLVRDVVFGRFRQAAVVAPAAPTAARTGATMGEAGVSAPPVEAVAAAPSASTFAWRRVVTEATAMWAATRVVMVAFTYFAVLITVSGRHHGYTSVSLHSLLDAWRQWDGVWYTNIAAQGYWKWQATAFFPLYPLLIKAGSLVAGQHWLLIAMAVSQVAALGAFVGVGLFAAQEEGTADGARRTLRVFAAYPLAFFLTAPYTEGLFIAFATFCLLFARRGAWRWAALCAFLAGLTRPTGIALVPALAWEFGRQHGWWRAVVAHPAWGHLRRRELRPALAGLDPRPGLRRYLAGQAQLDRRAVGDLALALGAVPAAIGAYMAYLFVRFGHPLVFFHVQAYYWHRENLAPWTSVPLAVAQYLRLPDLSYYQARDLVDLAPLLAFALITLVMLRRQPFAFTLYTAAILFLAIQGPVFNSPDPDLFRSAGRFLLAAVPVFLAVGRWTRDRPGLDLLLVGGGFMLQALLAAYFLAGGWLI